MLTGMVKENILIDRRVDSVPEWPHMCLWRSGSEALRREPEWLSRAALIFVWRPGSLLPFSYSVQTSIIRKSVLKFSLLPKNHFCNLATSVLAAKMFWWEERKHVFQMCCLKETGYQCNLLGPQATKSSFKVCKSPQSQSHQFGYVLEKKKNVIFTVLFPQWKQKKGFCFYFILFVQCC